MSRAEQIARKLKRAPVSLPGTPSGTHVAARPGGDTIPCSCGSCSNARRPGGWPMNLIVTLRAAALPDGSTQEEK